MASPPPRGSQPRRTGLRKFLASFKRVDDVSPPEAPTPAPDGSFALASDASPVGIFLFSLLLAVGWNIPVAVEMRKILAMPEPGGVGSLLVALPMLCLQALGIYWIWVAVKCFRALFIPRLRLALSTDRIVPGEAFTLRWSLDRAGQGTMYALLLEQRERIVKGDRARDVEKRVVAALPVAERLGADGAERGECALRIPADAAPVLFGDDRKVSWFLKVEEKTRALGLPEDFELPVEPPPAGA